MQEILHKISNPEGPNLKSSIWLTITMIFHFSINSYKQETGLFGL